MITSYVVYRTKYYLIYTQFNTYCALVPYVAVYIHSRTIHFNSHNVCMQSESILIGQQCFEKNIMT
mgnify:CR=1 FL=1